jgi:protein-tyrosine-phosphatase
MSAEYLTRKYIETHNIQNITVSSAGTRAHPEDPFSWTLEKLLSYGCDASHHHQRKITPEILSEQDLIICMAEHHRESVREL